MLDLDPLHAAIAEEHAANDGVGADAEVGARPHATTEVGARRADALAVDLVHRVRADAGGRRIVAVGAARKPELETRLDERGLPRNELRRGVPPDRDGASSSVPFVVEVEIVLEPLEGGKAVLPRPLGQSERCPFVVVVGHPAERDARVDGRRAAHHPATRKAHRDRAPPAVVGRAVVVAPVVRVQRVLTTVPQRRGEDLGVLRSVGVIRPSLDEDHVVTLVLGETRRDHRARGSCSDDDRTHAPTLP